MYVAIVDTETTGVAESDEAISAGILLLEIETPTGRLIRSAGHYLGYREPQKAIHPAAARVHGLSREQLSGRAFDVYEMERLIEAADVLVAHNAKFDARMLLPHVPMIVEKKWRCSWQQFPWPDGLPNKKLDTVCAHFDLERGNPHNALLDCGALGDCLLVQSGETEQGGTYFGKLLSSGDYGPFLEVNAPRTRAKPSNDESSQFYNPAWPDFARLDEENWADAAHRYERERTDERWVRLGTVCAVSAIALVAAILSFH
ncbi:exonuclease domain-containing protein [Paraburkholderia azotifigens]|uniref:Exonuclease domain-containing protein n=1 Tax=Paraburkholderia azotifigens TaxID=2057004 RepID=A0ABU9R3H7_9BURK